jgi:hypothetical protein
MKKYLENQNVSPKERKSYKVITIFGLSHTTKVVMYFTLGIICVSLFYGLL